MLFNLTDLIFESRNKLYGAYQLRKNYAYALFIAFLCNIPLLIACMVWIKYEQKQSINQKTEQYSEKEIMLQVNEDVEISDINDLPVLAESQEYFSNVASSELQSLQENTNDNSNAEIKPTDQLTNEKEPKKDTIDAPPKQDTTSKQQQSNSEQKPTVLYSPDVWSIYVKQNLQYPPQALRDKKECNVFVAVVIKEDGTLELDKERALYGCEEYFNEEVKRLIANAPRFIAATDSEGKPKNRINLKISFKLPQ